RSCLTGSLLTRRANTGKFARTRVGLGHGQLRGDSYGRQWGNWGPLLKDTSLQPAVVGGVMVDLPGTVGTP
ncbi:hypothetical protein, partial [Streptomyces sp. CoH27]|uniref:hypothetical protein n=1 Tax=Streptomyces sp. CoH27 TaxID=2875763 RepID=UPI001CD203FE